LLAKPWGEESARSKVTIAMNGGITDADKAIIKRVQELSEKKGVKMSQVALAWIRHKGAIPIVGLNSTSIQRLDEACAIGDVSLSAEEVKYLEELYVPKDVSGNF
jgi:aryl-alcohol dehydrogenase-like predicted oxidoreductase